jgi:hypothetical protein
MAGMNIRLMAVLGAEASGESTTQRCAVPVQPAEKADVGFT